MEKIKVGIVNYLNTRPLLYGIDRSELMQEIELVPDYPAAIAGMLLNNTIDVGLVPVAIIPKLEQYHINTGYCIGCNGAVASVCIFSEVPITEIKTLLLDYQSRTSVALARLLIREYWKIDPVLKDTGADYRSQIRGTTAGLVIGDRALEQRKKSPYIYDLGEAWKQYTGLPFVFAAWVSNKPLPPSFVTRFNAANGVGLQHIDDVVKENPYDVFNLHDYYTKYISYTLDAAKIKGLDRFLQSLGEAVR